MANETLRVRVLVAADGSAVSVTRVDSSGRVRSVIWQRDFSWADQPVTQVFEAAPPDPAVVDWIARGLSARQISAEQSAASAELRSGGSASPIEVDQSNAPSREGPDSNSTRSDRLLDQSLGPSRSDGGSL